MRFAASVAAILTAIVVDPAFAQDGDGKPTPAQSCAEFFDRLDQFETTSQTRIEDLAAGCRVRDVYVNSGSYMRYHITSATLSAPALFEAYAADRLPAQADLTVEGLVFDPDMGSPATSYLMRAQSEPLDIHVAYRWNEQARTAELADFSVHAGIFGRFRLSGRFSDVDLDPGRLRNMAALPVTVDHLALDLSNARFFTGYILPLLINLLPADEDPEPMIDTYKQTTIGWIDALPAQTIGADSKAALTTFVRAFPRPTGSYEVEIKADPGLVLNPSTIGDPTAAEAMLSRLKIAASHTPAQP